MQYSFYVASTKFWLAMNGKAAQLRLRPEVSSFLSQSCDLRYV